MFDNLPSSSGHMRVIKETRNELFHSNPIKDRKKIIEACERILSGLQFHLGDYDHDLGAAQYVRVPATVARARATSFRRGEGGMRIRLGGSAKPLQ
ncbi:hypothetical protein PMI09_05021 [Rhizobium sp. CF122]|uniref:hypothetical protein n=1 Tax=Rhizobium sp. CF122 TaxID=1144312 RepID=UPI000271A9AB|nr:hypothetical protein [Rhizobium sp. CF122]EJL50524.1 hypothetical protein PMI09_05021 [Rhizobium sp. CF122]